MKKKVFNQVIKIFLPLWNIVKIVVPVSVSKRMGDKVFNRPSAPGFIDIYDPIAQQTFQMFWRMDFHVERAAYQSGIYGDWEKESLKIWAHLSKKANVILDIGANTGVYSLLAKNNNKNAKVIAIEPVDINYDFLMGNIKQNNFDIAVEKIALSDKEDTARMFMLKDTLNYMTSVNDNRYALHPEVQQDIPVVEIIVPIKPYSFVHEKHQLNNMDLVKIDVEGHEISVLNGMMPYIEKSKPSILIEIIGDDNAAVLDKMFKQVGYSYVSINEDKPSVVVDKLWDNDHHNFLICTNEVIEFLRSQNLVK